jgi:multidrug efflux pump
VITISTQYYGAAANIMESFVTTPLENSLTGIDGVDFVTSASTTGASDISVYFELGYDINQAITNVSNAISSKRYLLPKEVQDPIISKNDPNAQPVLFIPFMSNVIPLESMTDYLVRAVQPQISSLPGISSTMIYGQRQYAMRIWLNPQKMAAYGVTGTDISNALNNNNIQTAAGKITSQWQEFNVMAKTDLNTPEQFNSLVIKNVNGKFVRLKDIGYAQLGAADDSVTVSINGKNAMVFAVIPQSSANPIEISKEIHKIFPSIQQFLPKGMFGTIMYDASKFISTSIKEVYRTILEATVFVIIVIFMFLGSFRNALIPIITIPLSIVGVCGFMLSMGYSINTLTLLAWVLAIGLVVDDAIVVVENIHRHIESGLSPFEAALKGAREIGFAIIAMTLTLAAVYAPIGFVTGLTGALFREFAFTLAGAVIISGFVALTLSPMMCAKLLKHSNQNKAGLPEKIDYIFNKMMNKYKHLLTVALNKKVWVIFIAAVIYLGCYVLYSTLSNELAPKEDEGFFMSIVQGPSNANLDYTISQTDQLAKIFQTVPEQLGYGFVNGFGGSLAPNSAFAFLVLKNWEDRKRTVDQIIYSLFPQFMSLPGVRAFPFNPSQLPGSSGNTPVEFVLKTTGSYIELNNAAQELMQIAAKGNPRLLNIDSDLKMDQAQVNIDFNRNKAADLGIPMSDINTTLNIALAQPVVSRFNMNGRSYDVIPRLLPQFRTQPSQLAELNVRTSNGELIPLSTFSNVQTLTQSPSLNHFQQLRATKITASLAPGYTLGDALLYLEKIAKENLPSNIQYDFSGQSRQYVQASGAMEQTFIIAILFIFLVLAAQFESFRDPLIVMVSVPLSTAGALLTLHLVPGGTLNIYTQIGLVTLIGLISKHGILIVEFANQLQAQGRTKIEAIVESASIRLRPVLMTTFAMILGALPLALSKGAGAISRSQLGWVIVGGMAFGTLFTLFVVPAVYAYLASVKKHD